MNFYVELKDGGQNKYIWLSYSTMNKNKQSAKLNQSI